MESGHTFVAAMRGGRIDLRWTPPPGRRRATRPAAMRGGRIDLRWPPIRRIRGPAAAMRGGRIDLRWSRFSTEPRNAAMRGGRIDLRWRTAGDSGPQVRRRNEGRPYRPPMDSRAWAVGGQHRPRAAMRGGRIDLRWGSLVLPGLTWVVVAVCERSLLPTVVRARLSMCATMLRLMPLYHSLVTKTYICIWRVSHWSAFRFGWGLYPTFFQ